MPTIESVFLSMRPAAAAFVDSCVNRQAVGHREPGRDDAKRTQGAVLAEGESGCRHNVAIAYCIRVTQGRGDD